jgi:hypothetical protein
MYSFIMLSLLLIFYFSVHIIICDAPRAWGLYFQNSASSLSYFITLFSYPAIIIICALGGIALRYFFSTTGV